MAELLTVLFVGVLNCDDYPEDGGKSVGVEVHSCEASDSVVAIISSSENGWVIFGENVGDDELNRLFSLVRAISPVTHIAILGDSSDWRRCDAWVRRGCQVYMKYGSSFKRIINVIVTSSLCEVTIVDQVFQQLREARRSIGLPKLTKREDEVLKLLHRGLSNRDIASILYVSQSTVEYHMKHILKKLGARSRLEAVERSTALGLY